jgi:Ser/Thr protein kinase RdoA (MazF antagonist)
MSVSDPPSDEEMRKLLKPAPTEDQVLELLKDHYGGNVAIVKQLDSYDDSNYLVTIDGISRLLKIHNGVESEDYVRVKTANFYEKGKMTSVIHLQNAIMELLNEHEICTSRPIKPKDSDSPVVVIDLPVVSKEHCPYKLVVRLFSWVEGRTMSSIKLLPIESLGDAGRFLGKIDKVLDLIRTPNGLTGALERFGSSAALWRQGSSRQLLTDVPETNHLTADLKDDEAQTAVIDTSLLIPASRYHAWDGKNTLDLRKYVHHVTNEKRRNMVISIIDAFESSIVDSGDSKLFRLGVNHGDFNDANIIVDQDLQTIAVIDFGDVVER